MVCVEIWVTCCYSGTAFLVPLATETIDALFFPILSSLSLHTLNDGLPATIITSCHMPLQNLVPFKKVAFYSGPTVFIPLHITV